MTILTIYFYLFIENVFCFRFWKFFWNSLLNCFALCVFLQFQLKFFAVIFLPILVTMLYDCGVRISLLAFSHASLLGEMLELHQIAHRVLGNFRTTCSVILVRFFQPFCPCRLGIVVDYCWAYRFLTKCRKRLLNLWRFVLLYIYFALFASSELYSVCVFSCTVLFVSISQVIDCEDHLWSDL